MLINLAHIHVVTVAPSPLILTPGGLRFAATKHQQEALSAVGGAA
jgi:hypothetical protein